MADGAEERTTMMNALREEPGSYTRGLEDGAEVTYEIQPSSSGFVAGWEYISESEPARSHEEEFSSYADALRYLEKNFDAPLGQ